MLVLQCALMHRTRSDMLVRVAPASGGSVWFGWGFWLYLPGATRVHLQTCSSYCRSCKSAKTLIISLDYRPSAVTCRRRPVIFLLCLVTKTTKQAERVGWLSASLASWDYSTLLLPPPFPAKTCSILRRTFETLNPRADTGFRTKRHEILTPPLGHSALPHDLPQHLHTVTMRITSCLLPSPQSRRRRAHTTLLGFLFVSLSD